MRNLFVLGCLGLLFTIDSAACACSLSDFVLKQADWRKEPNNFINIVGEVTNNCGESAGVQLQAVFRDADKKVVDTEEFWPASTRNIAAGSNYAFSMLTSIGPEAVTMNMLVIDVRTWGDD